MKRVENIQLKGAMGEPTVIQGEGVNVPLKVFLLIQSTIQAFKADKSSDEDIQISHALLGASKRFAKAIDKDYVDFEDSDIAAILAAYRKIDTELAAIYDAQFVEILSQAKEPEEAE